MRPSIRQCSGTAGVTALAFTDSGAAATRVAVVTLAAPLGRPIDEAAIALPASAGQAVAGFSGGGAVLHAATAKTTARHAVPLLNCSSISVPDLQRFKKARHHIVGRHRGDDLDCGR